MKDTIYVIIVTVLSSDDVWGEVVNSSYTSYVGYIRTRDEEEVKRLVDELNAEEKQAAEKSRWRDVKKYHYEEVKRFTPRRRQV